MNRLSSFVVSNTCRVSARRITFTNASRSRTVVGAVAGTASLGVCLFEARTPLKLETLLEKAAHEVEHIKEEVEKDVALIRKASEEVVHKVEDQLHKVEDQLHKVEDQLESIKHEVEEDVLLVKHKTEEVIHEIEEVAIEKIVHPLRDTWARVAPYVMPMARFVSKYKNYLAYSSDVGEAFRPIASSKAVNASYAIALAYVCGDVLHNGYQQYEIDSTDMGSVALTMVHSAVFQALASVTAPFLIIHTAVGKSNSLYFQTPKCSTPFLKTWGASIVALAIIPFLPLVDEPIEEGVDWVFDHVVPHKANNREHESQQQKSVSTNAVSVTVPSGILPTGTPQASQ